MKKSEGSENIELSDTEGLKSFAYYDSRTFHGTNPSGVRTRSQAVSLPSAVMVPTFSAVSRPQEPYRNLVIMAFFPKPI